MKRWEDIAVIGMSGIFPEAKNIDQYRENLRLKKDCIREVPKSRLRLLGLEEEREYLECGYIEGVDLFDYEFFGFSKGEAVSMDPQKRLSMVLACEAFENAGYSLDKIRGTKTCVILSAGNSGYYNYLAQENESIAQMGNNNGMIAGNISYLLDLRAKAYMIDTTCSSSLLAIYQGCDELINKEADMALVGGVSVIVTPKRKEEMNHRSTGVVSKEMRSRSFDESANGTGIGEGGGLVILKRLKDALKDKDCIYAVIKSGAVNHSGANSNSMVAPSPIAQKEVINKAWEGLLKQGEFPEMIEAHGTGTKIGDPIEVESLGEVFARNQEEKIHLTAAKSNIGHLGVAAGVASFIKVALSVYHDEIYPLVHFKQGNTLINWEEILLEPSTALCKYKNKIRRAGITSLGLSGTNVHLIVESKDVLKKKEKSKKNIFTLSARSEELLEQYLKDIKNYIMQNEHLSEGEIARTLNAGRNHHPYRVAFTYTNREELLAGIETQVTQIKKVNETPMLYLVCGGIYEETEVLWKRWEIGKKLNKKDLQDKQKYLNFYQELKKNMFNIDVSMKGVIGGSGGNAIAKMWLLGKDEIISQEEFETFNQKPVNKEMLKKYLEDMTSKQVVYISLEDKGDVHEVLSQTAHNDNIVWASSEEEFICQLYLKGIEINWEKYYGGSISKVHLPSQPFNQISCWSELINSDLMNKKSKLELTNDKDTKYENNDVEEALKEIWADCLGIEDINIEDDFFDLGGNSIIGIKILQAVNGLFGEVFQASDLYEYPTIEKMNDRIAEIKKVDVVRKIEKIEKKEEYKIIPLETKEYYELSDAQRRMWLMYSISEDKAEYNMPSTMIIRGNFDYERFKNAFQKVVDKHDAFRTSFHVIEGRPMQRIQDSVELQIEFGEFTQEEAYKYKKEFIQPFDLEHASLMRISVLKINSSLHWVLLDMHHIISDGTSMGIISRDFWTVYNGGTLQPNEVKYRDFAHWQKEFGKTETKRKQDAYWLEEFKGFEQKDNLLPKDYPRPNKRDDDGEIMQFRLEQSELALLKEFAKRMKVTLNTLFLSCYYIALFKSSASDECVVGLPITGRRTAQMQDLVGMFVNMLSIRISVENDETYSSFLRRLHTKVVKAYDNQDTPFNELVDMLKIRRKANINPIFESVFVLQELEMPTVERGDAELEYINEDATAKFDIVFSGYHDKDEIVFNIRYWKKIFSKKTIEDMMMFFRLILNEILNGEDTLILNLGCTNNAKVKEKINDTNTQFDFSFEN